MKEREVGILLILEELAGSYSVYGTYRNPVVYFDKLEMQAKAGADVLMLFDSWSHMIPNNFFNDCAISPTARIIDILRSRKFLYQ